MRKLNRSTYHSEYSQEPIKAEIGDVKQRKFHPRVKITKWDNEANFSLGLDVSPRGTHSISSDGTVTYRDGDVSARFYNLTDTGDIPLKSIRRVTQHGEWTALEAAAQYEMFNNIGKPGEMLLATYTTTEPAMVAFDNMPVSSHMDVDRHNTVKDFNYPDKSGYNANDIPMPSFDRLRLVRFLTPYTPVVNPMYMDDGLAQIIVQWHGSDLDQEQVVSIQMDAVEHVMNKHGYPTERHPFRAKLYVKHGDRLVKFFSGQPDKGGLYSYVNLRTNYNKAYDFYKPDVFKDIRDKYAYGLQYVYPEIKDSIVDEMMDEFARRLKVPVHDQPLSKDETAQWQTTQKLHDDHDWIAGAKRSDAGWVRVEPKDGLEFEVVLASKPRSNLVKLSTNNPKNVTAYYQAEFSFEEMVERKMERSPEIMKSLAVYHVEKKNNEYKTGKVAHIYRPMAWDSTGLKVWCDFKELNGLREGQEYDLSKGLTIEVPQDFLDEANYPVTVDPTFGYTTAGATIDGNNGNILLGQSVTGALGKVDSIVVYQSSVATEACKTAIYNGSDSTLLKGSTEQNPTAGVAWVTFTGFSSQAITATNYFLEHWSHATAGTYGTFANRPYYDASSDTIKYQSLTYVAGNSPTGWPSPGTFSTLSDRTYSIYCDYTATYEINKSESSGVTDSVGRMVQSFVNKSDSSGVTDVPIVKIESGVSVSDTTTITESINFDQPGARFWVGGTGNFSSSANWSASSGGSGGASVPGSNNTVTFDSSSGTGTVTFDVSPTIQSVTSSSANITLNLSSSTTTVTNTGTAWNLTAGTVTAGTSSITLNGASAGFAGGSKTYGNLTMSGSGTMTMSGSNTFATLTRTGTAAFAGFSITGGTTQTCTNFICNGNAALYRVFLQTTSAFSGQVTISVSSTVTVTNTDFMGIIGSGAASWFIDSTTNPNGNIGGNSGITFLAGSNMYWVGNGGNWSDVTNHWSTTDGGTPNDAGSRMPLVQDTASFTSSSFSSGSQTVTVDTNRVGLISCSGVTNSPTIGLSLATTRFFKNITLCPSMTFDINSRTFEHYNMYNSSTITSSTATYAATSGVIQTNAGITSAVLTFADSITLPGTGGIASFGGNVKATTGITVTVNACTGGTFGTFDLGGTGTTWNLTATSGTPWNTNGGGVTNGTGSTIALTNASSSTRTFSGGSKTYGTLTYTVAGSTGQLNISGSNTFSDINFSDNSNARTLAFTAATTTTITSSFNVQGSTAGNMTIGSITAASHTLTKSSGTVSCDYLTISRSTAQGGAIWAAGLHSTDNGNNSGWVFGGSDVTDTSAVTESIGRMVESYVNKSDGSAVTDTPVVEIDGGVSVSDTSGVTDTPVVSIDGGISVSDTSAVTENVVVTLIAADDYNISVSDGSTITDTPVVQEISVMAVSDSTLLTDTPVVMFDSGINVSDSSTVTDSSTVIITEFNIVASDSSTVTDNAVVSVEGVSDNPVTVSDTFGVTDSTNVSIVAVGALTNNLSDSTTTSELVVVTIAGVSDLLIDVNDTSTITEDTVVIIGVAGNPLVTTSDATTISELPLVSILGVSDLLIATSETSNVTESGLVSISSLALSIAVSDNVTPSESVGLVIVAAAVTYGLWEFFE